MNHPWLFASSFTSTPVPRKPETRIIHSPEPPKSVIPLVINQCLSINYLLTSDCCEEKVKWFPTLTTPHWISVENTFRVNVNKSSHNPIGKWLADACFAVSLGQESSWTSCGFCWACTPEHCYYTEWLWHYHCVYDRTDSLFYCADHFVCQFGWRWLIVWRTREYVIDRLTVEM